MGTKNKEEKLELLRKRMVYEGACYMDPKGLSSGLAVWWKEQDKVRIIGKCKNLIDMDIIDSAKGLMYRIF